MTAATAEAMLREAAALRRAGRVPEAITAYERLLERWPNLPDSWYNLAYLQRRAHRFDAALMSYGQALKRGASQGEEIHLNCAVIYADHLRDDGAAERELNAALALNPTYAPALLNLGNLLEDRGERESALALYERVLAIHPAHVDALARLANLTARPGPDEPLIPRLRRALAVAASAADKANLGFALGRLLDARGAYDEAFAAYAEANRQSRGSAGSSAPLYDRAGHERFVETLIETFPTRIADGHASKSGLATGAEAGPGDTEQRSPPIFICGMFRSGSTLAEQVLASHRDVTAGGELPFIPSMVQSELAPYPASMVRIAERDANRLARRYLDTLASMFPAAKTITDKRPDNFLHIGLIKTLFPSAKIVNTVRHPLDNCLSVFFLHLDHSMGYALDLSDIAHYYAQYRRLMGHWKQFYQSDILDFDYDVFVREPRSSIERLLSFCGLDWDENCMSFHRARNAVKTASVWQVREPLYDRSSGRWRNYERHLLPLLDQFANEPIGNR